MSYVADTAETVDTVPISHTSLVDLAVEIGRTGRPKVLTRDGVGELIVLPLREYEQLREAMEVASALLRGDADVAAGRVVSNDEAQDLLRASIKAAAGSSHHEVEPR